MIFAEASRQKRAWATRQCGQSHRARGTRLLPQLWIGSGGAFPCFLIPKRTKSAAVAVTVFDEGNESARGASST